MPNKMFMSKSGDQDNEAFVPEGKTGPPMLEDLPPEHRQKYDQVMVDLAEEVLKHFTWTCSRGIKCTGTPESALDGIGLSVPSEERSQALRQEINYMIHHALLRQTEVILNSIDNIVARVSKSILAGEYEQDISPVVIPHVGEKKFYMHPLQMPQINASEGTKAEFVLCASQDLYDKPTYYEEPPAFIPEG